jgi:hypothetical protein
MTEVKVKPGPYQESDGSPVTAEDANAAWIPLARQALEKVARVYPSVIDYGTLAEEVQSTSGIRTNQVLRHWIGDVLGAVTSDCSAKGEPLLSALCVRQDGSIGDGYGVALVETYGGVAPDDLELAAAEERLRCYQYFGATMPADGGRPTLTPTVAARRRVASRRAREDRVRPSCPSCHIRLSASGECEYCN